MGAAIVLPERIDQDTARALIGNERVYRATLARAPWVVHRWQEGKLISKTEARAIWERERFDGAPRASYDYLEKVPFTKHRVEPSSHTEPKDYERTIVRL